MKNGRDKAGEIYLPFVQQYFVLRGDLYLCIEATPRPRYALFSHLSAIPRDYGGSLDVRCPHLRFHKGDEHTRNQLLRPAEDPIERGSTKGMRHGCQMLSKTRGSNVRRGVYIYKNEALGC